MFLRVHGMTKYGHAAILLCMGACDFIVTNDMALG